MEDDPSLLSSYLEGSFFSALSRPIIHNSLTPPREPLLYSESRLGYVFRRPRVAFKRISDESTNRVK